MAGNKQRRANNASAKDKADGAAGAAAAAGGCTPCDGPGETELRRRAEAGDALAGGLLGEVLMERGEEAEAVKWVRWAA